MIAGRKASPRPEFVPHFHVTPMCKLLLATQVAFENSTPVSPGLPSLERAGAELQLVWMFSRGMTHSELKPQFNEGLFCWVWGLRYDFMTLTTNELAEITFLLQTVDLSS